MNSHITKSKIFLYFCLSFALGILAASFLKISVLTPFLLAILAVIFSSIFWREKKIVIAGFCLIFLALGIYRFWSAMEEKSLISQYNDRPEKIVLEGIVVEEPDIRIKDTQYIIRVKSLKLKVESLPCEIISQNAEFPLCGISQGSDAGKILATAPHYPPYRYGDRVKVEGKLKAPAEFDSFSYKDYLAKDGIYSVMYSPDMELISSGNGNFAYAAIFEIKNKFKEKLKLILAEPENSLLAGLLLGERSGLVQSIKDAFAVTGTSHIVAVSGFNVTIIAVIILELALGLGFSRRQSFWISLAAIILFIIMVGAPSSAIRAGVMGGLILVAIRVGRLNSITNAIVFAAVLMLAINPKILRFDAGFQLSFLAVVGIVWLYPVLERCFSGKNAKDPEKKETFFRGIKNAFLMTLSAQIMALPVLLNSFGNLSLVAPFANILILPFVPIAMGLGFLGGIISFFWIAPAKIIGYFTWLVLAYQIRTIEYLASFSWASVKIFNFGFELFAAYYIIVGRVILKSKTPNPKF